MQNYPAEVTNFATDFVEMQDLRHTADYDPLASIPTKDEVIQYIGNAENAIRQLPDAPVVDRRSFAVHVLVPARRN